MQKIKNKQEGGKNFFTPLCVYTYVYISFHILFFIKKILLEKRENVVF